MYEKMRMLILLTLKKLNSMKAFLFCKKRRGVSDILNSFVNTLVSHKINETEWWKNLSGCAKGLSAVRIQLLGNLQSYGLILEGWENPCLLGLFDNKFTINNADLA